MDQIIRILICFPSIASHLSDDAPHINAIMGLVIFLGMSTKADVMKQTDYLSDG